MDDDYLKRFGFLPSSQLKECDRQRHKAKRQSERFYIRDTEDMYLTTREAETAWLMSRAFTLREAAEALELSARTVEYYLSNVRRKLGVQHKYEMLEYLNSRGFFDEWNAHISDA